MKKRILSLALVLMMCLFLFPVSSLAADENVVLDITVRDFNKDGVLFDGTISLQEGLVQATLDSNKKPVFNLDVWQETFDSSITQAQLDAFFTDVPGYNMTTKKQLVMRPDGEGYWVIDSSVDEDGNYLDGFFPIDNELFGNEEYEHNYHFSVEIHTRFKYVQGAEFEFSGDDDVWVFFNDQLVIDLGGVHSSESAYVTLDDIAADLGIKVGDIVEFDMFYMERCYSGSNMYIRTNFDFLNLNASEWAKAELAQAASLGLIPDCLMGTDMTKPITRAEFAAVAVKVYESLTGTKSVPAAVNPFKDCSDAEVLKAYGLGIVLGISADEFQPDTLLDRQTAATMLTRTYKKVALDGWTLADDGKFSDAFHELYSVNARLSDDGKISSWAYDSVYFMYDKGLIKGIGKDADGLDIFNPRNVTSDEEAMHYANATREAALLIATRLVTNLG